MPISGALRTKTLEMLVPSLMRLLASAQAVRMENWSPWRPLAGPDRMVAQLVGKPGDLRKIGDWQTAGQPETNVFHERRPLNVAYMAQASRYVFERLYHLCWCLGRHPRRPYSVVLIFTSNTRGPSFFWISVATASMSDILRTVTPLAFRARATPAKSTSSASARAAGLFSAFKASTSAPIGRVVHYHHRQGDLVTDRRLQLLEMHYKAAVTLEGHAVAFGPGQGGAYTDGQSQPIEPKSPCRTMDSASGTVM